MGGRGTGDGIRDNLPISEPRGWAELGGVAVQQKTEEAEEKEEEELGFPRIS